MSYRILGKKYFNPDPSQDIESKSTFDGIAYRYAETLLINAEAKAELGTIKQEDLNNTVNKLRDRVGMPHLTLQVGFEDAKWPQWGYTCLRCFRRYGANGALSLPVRIPL